MLVRWANPNRAITDLTPGSSVVTLSHTVSSEDEDFDGVNVRNVYVNLFKAAHVEPEVPEEPTPGAGLAATGATPAQLLGFGALILLLGAALMLFAGRRREPSN